MPLARRAPFQRDGGHTASGNAARARVARDAASGASMVVADWANDASSAVLTVTMRVETARASGLPARDLYGIRVAPSTESPGLGRAGGNITTAQHCRAEILLDRYGWVPVDPADVRKVMLEERPQAVLADPYIAKVRARLFGSWEGNWFAFNDAHDVMLPGSSGKPLPFLMYPQAEAGSTRRDSLDPEHFKYEITARELNKP